ncbi:MAG: hypothetical protein TREMPRED_005574 [Tremellales sp. Tagirdzhanova-0007]|nr:MAG: hypothetical protein TREMPRED_005574 [Tremellales sp. Tagirdzhanova-0007]
MGLFSRKKNASSSASSPSQSPIPTAHPSPTFPSLSLNDLEVPPTVLRVALDPAPVGAASAGGLFYVSVNPGDDVSAIRRAVIEKLGNVSMGLFKVCFLQCILTKAHPIQVAIPWQARQQARAYTEQYDVPVNLIASFPSYNLDDPEQFAQSLGLAGWQSAESNTPSTITIDDWFPSSVGRQSDMISVLVRTDFGVSSGSIPFTFVAHFAPPDPPRTCRPSSSSRPIKAPKTLPVVVDISPSSTVNQLKAAVLLADGRPSESLDSVALWRVDMSEDEMIVIGERGGLKGGRMPWPYPPTASVPVSLSESNQTLSHYFADAKSNGRMVNLSVWIHPSAISKLARRDEDAPLFKYSLEAITKDHKSSPPQPISSGPECEPITISATLPSLSSTRSHSYSGDGPRRGRPSTAPTSAVSSGGKPKIPVFGSRTSSHGTTRTTSPLAKEPAIPSFKHSDRDRPGFQPTRVSTTHEGSGSDTSDDLDSLPSLISSQLSLCIGQYTRALPTPDTDKWMDWDSPNEHGQMVKPLGISSLGYLRA